MAILRNTEEVTGSGVQEGVTRRCSGGQDDGIDNVRQDRDRRTLHRDDPRGPLCALGIRVSKLRIVARNDHANEEGSEDVEEENALIRR